MQHEFTSKRLNRLAAALGAKSYLEIGVHTGGTFARVQVAERTAVDPAFPFPAALRECLEAIGPAAGQLPPA